jgi:hypothetical protein
MWITPRQCSRPVAVASLSRDQVRETLLWEGSMVQLPIGAKRARLVVVSAGLLRSRSSVMTTPRILGLDCATQLVRLTAQSPLGTLLVLVLEESLRPAYP